jgi:hypothetical protein
MWKEDCIQIALNPDRGDFQYDEHSWLYIWGGYRGAETELGVSLHAGRAETHVWEKPERLENDSPTSLVKAAARRVGMDTIYEAAISWDLIPDFTPQAGRSLGICIVVNDMDQTRLKSAEYGTGVVVTKRPSEFAAIRLGR